MKQVINKGPLPYQYMKVVLYVQFFCLCDVIFFRLHFGSY